MSAFGSAGGLMKGSFSVTVDLEDWYHIPSVCSSPYAVYRSVNEFFEKWDGRYDFLTEPTNRVLDILDEFNVTATFFVVADTVEHYPGLVESIVERGHELACHGLHHACKIDPETKTQLMSNEEFEQRTLLAKRILEKISGEKVVGYRAPNALIGGWMLDSLEQIGFKYDSSVSVNSLYNKTDSALKTVSSIPYYPVESGLETGNDRNFIEFPWAYYQNVLKIPASWRANPTIFGSFTRIKWAYPEPEKRTYNLLFPSTGHFLCQISFNREPETLLLVFKRKAC